MIYCDIPEKCTELLAEFDNIHAAVNQEITDVYIPGYLSETEKALYQSAYWASLENYKEKGDYKAFMAGCRYLSPM